MIGQTRAATIGGACDRLPLGFISSVCHKEQQHLVQGVCKLHEKDRQRMSCNLMLPWGRRTRNGRRPQSAGDLIMYVAGDHS